MRRGGVETGLQYKPHLASLSGYVRDLADVRILELEFTKTDDGTAQLLLDKELSESVDLVGISCWTSMHYLGTIAIAERVRHLFPDTPIVIGGTIQLQDQMTSLTQFVTGWSEATANMLSAICAWNGQSARWKCRSSQAASSISPIRTI